MAYNPHKDPSRRLTLNVELVVVAKKKADLPDGNEVAERFLNLLASNNGSLKVKSKDKGCWVATSVLVHRRHTVPEVCDRIGEAMGMLDDNKAAYEVLQRLKEDLDPVNHA